jgi:hypothetical protein
LGGGGGGGRLKEGGLEGEGLEMPLCLFSVYELGTGDSAQEMLKILYARPERLEFGVKGKPSSSSEIVLVTVIIMILKSVQ